ncbi:hypothetical protein B6U99_00005 [Candidatus Geothermarchaeota archaeon ex4572_27]|nr:MAG: hypothetical protein B6U99_00005 [Candidatus Geothermarchaeota archaeon ex4572_27]
MKKDVKKQFGLNLNSLPLRLLIQYTAKLFMLLAAAAHPIHLRRKYGRNRAQRHPAYTLYHCVEKVVLERWGLGEW